MNNLDELYSQWTQATASLPYGVQRVFSDVFVLASEGKTNLIYGADYYNGSPCLVNTVGVMLKVGGGSEIPSQHFGQVVGLFDKINRELETAGVNDRPGYVSQLAADIFRVKFAPLKEPPIETPDIVTPTMTADFKYTEPSDEEIAKDLVSMFMTDAPCEIKFSDDLQRVEVIDLEIQGELDADYKFSSPE